MFYGLETVASDRICYGIITRDNIYRVWIPNVFTNDWKTWKTWRTWQFAFDANIVIDLSNQRYIKHRNAEPTRLGRPSDEVRILFAHTKRYEIDPTSKTLIEINIPETTNE